MPRTPCRSQTIDTSCLPRGSVNKNPPAEERDNDRQNDVFDAAPRLAIVFDKKKTASQSFQGRHSMYQVRRDPQVAPYHKDGCITRTGMADNPYEVNPYEVGTDSTKYADMDW